MDWNTELEISRKSAPKKGRRAGINIPFGSQGNETSSSSLTGMDSSPLSSAGSNRSSKRVDSQPVAPPRSRKTGGWAEEAIKSGKRKNGSSNLIEQERFQSPDRMKKNDSDDDIPLIPDLDDLQDDQLGSQIAQAPSVAINRVATYKELDSDLFRHAAFTTIDDVNLQLLAKCLSPENDLKEKDESWTWDLLFTDVASQLHTDWELEASGGAILSN
ncbi:hypothetical protein R5R35_005120 [Gryllus longicercus]|uniref:Intraflagellar transport protein 43 homolog n=1 Tax=Gryllus longicercus TaxID=2509291 RepID=A0AAN9V8W2_9ORTH